MAASRSGTARRSSSPTLSIPYAASELRRADAHSAVDLHGAVYFFHSADCRAAFDAEPERYAAQAAGRLVDSPAP